MIEVADTAHEGGSRPGQSRPPYPSLRASLAHNNGKVGAMVAPGSQPERARVVLHSVDEAAGDRPTSGLGVLPSP